MSSILTTMAMLKVSWDESRSYLDNFEPFVIDCLKDWNNSKAVEPEELREALGQKFSIPRLPINTTQELRDRLINDGILVRRGRKIFVVRAELDARPTLSETKTTVLAHIRELSDRLIEYVATEIGLEWTETESLAALESFSEEFSAELAVARRQGGLAPHGGHVAEVRLNIVHAFAVRAIERDERSLSLLEEMVQGSILANVLYFQDVGQWTESMRGLTVYLDATPVIRMLEGMAPGPQHNAAVEMLALLKEASVAVKVFEHTVDEIEGVLEGVAAGMRYSARSPESKDSLNRANGETLRHLMSSGGSPSDVESVISTLTKRIKKLGIQVVEAPATPDSPDYSEALLEEILQNRINYTSAPAKLKDTKSLIGIHNLRRGYECREYRKTPAMFVTANQGLRSAGQEFFKREGLHQRIPHVITDITLTTQLWLRKSDGVVPAARTQLIAESYAALSPSGDFWEKFSVSLEKLRAEGGIGPEEVKALVYSIEARPAIIEAAKGDADLIDFETPTIALEKFERRVRLPEEARAVQAEESLREAEEKVAAAEARAQASDARAELLAEEMKVVSSSLTEFKEKQSDLADGRNESQKSAAFYRKLVFLLCGVVVIFVAFVPVYSAWTLEDADLVAWLCCGLFVAGTLVLGGLLGFRRLWTSRLGFAAIILAAGAWVAVLAAALANQPLSWAASAILIALNVVGAFGVLIAIRETKLSGDS